MKSFIVYHSSTGFTRRYAEQLAEKVGAAAVPLREAAAQTVGADLVIFGTRAHCGTIDKLSRGIRLLQKSGAPHCALFVTGAAPADAAWQTEELWRRNLPRAGAETVPHFYVPAGLNYEEMNRTDRFLMKGLAWALKHKRNKTADDLTLAKSIASSFDISSPSYLAPILAWVQTAKA